MPEPSLTLRELLEDGHLAISVDALDALTPPPPIPSLDFDRVEGMLLGLAIGDALGNTTEAALPGARRARHGEIRDYLPNKHADRKRVGLPSDDSQLAFWTLEHLLEHGRIVPEALAATFVSRRIFGIGHTVSDFRDELARGEPWYRAARPSAGNGAVMRIAPVLIPHLREPSPALWEDTILAAALTHADATSIGACVALVGILPDLLVTPGPLWRFVDFPASTSGTGPRDPTHAAVEPATFSLLRADRAAAGARNADRA